MGLMETINYYYYDLADPRMRDWFLLSSIWYPITIILIYLVTIYKLVPDYMKNRPAYKLNTFIKCYNLFQVIVNIYLVKEFSYCYPFLRALECRPVIYTMDPCAIQIVKASYITLCIKILDLIETVIFILRKKNNQVTGLHLYHHISTVLFAMIFMRYISVEVTILFPILNCAVHVVMYFYYFLSNFEGPIKQVIVPFKRYLTIMQMAQFVIFLIQMIVAGFLRECTVPKIFIVLMTLNILLNLGLFYHFYQRTYIYPKQKKPKL